MTKAEIVADISEETGLERSEALRAVEAFMHSIKRSLSDGQNVYLRGFGSFVVKRRAKKNGEKHFKKDNGNYSGSQYPFFQTSKSLC